MIAILAGGDDGLVGGEIDKAITHGEQYMAQYSALAEQVAERDWNKVVILADSELEGIASEAALAFAEIPQLPANYYHVLDVRHGPMVLVDQKNAGGYGRFAGRDKAAARSNRRFAQQTGSSYKHQHGRAAGFGR